MLRNLIITLVIFCLAGARTSRSTHIGQIKQQQKIRIGTLAGESTYYISSDGELGFEYELAEAFAKLMLNLR